MTLGDSQALGKIVEGTPRPCGGLQGPSEGLQRCSDSMFGQFLDSWLLAIPKIIDLSFCVENNYFEQCRHTYRQTDIT